MTFETSTIYYMSCNPCQVPSILCADKFGCPQDTCPDFQIKRHDTKPPFTVEVNDCDGPIDLTDVVVEVSMWAKAKLKKAITITDTYFALADDIGFEQSLVGDIIVINRVRAPEQMLITGHDETNKLIRVERGYHGTTADNYPKGTPIHIFRVLNSFGETEMVNQDVVQIDGSTETVLTESLAIYNWLPNDTCLPGCYYLEFKLLKMDSESLMLSAITPSFTSITPSVAGCRLGDGVEWIRRMPIEGEGFLVQIIDTKTEEGLYA